jgi:hypothetical protein
VTSLSLLRPRATPEVRDRFVIAAHHPDRLDRPPPRLGAVESERCQQALAWNVFRTLELIAPAFWLRRLHVRLTGHAPTTATSQTVKVGLWRSLPLPPIQRIDGARPSVLVDVLIETEHAVWTLIAADGSDASERLTAIIDAGAWLAGARDYSVGVIDSGEEPALSRATHNRFSRSPRSVALRSATRGPAVPRVRAHGALSWPDLAAVLHDYATSDALPEIERLLAHNALDWLRSIGITPNS